MSGIIVESKSNIPEGGLDEDQSTRWKKKLYTKNNSWILGNRHIQLSYAKQKIVSKPRKDISPMWFPAT